jgi:hypothetical protein
MSFFGKDDRRWPITGIYEDAQGRFAYFSLGRFGRGRILPSAEAADALEKKVAIATSFIGCAIAVFIGALIAFDASLFLTWPNVFLSFVCFYLYDGWLVRGLPISDVRFDTQAWRQRQQSRSSRRDLMLTLAFSSAMLLYFLQGGPVGHPWLHAASLASLAFLLAMTAWRFITRKYRD